MDDVLPKPFTRKSLLDMLEKHLVHLKSLPAAAAAGVEAAPTSTTAVSMAPQSSANPSIKEDNSPGQSPATATSMNNWQSPSQFQGVSPMHPNVPQVQNQYVQQPGPGPAAYTIDQNGVQYPTTQAPLNAATARPQHRRQISEMSSAPEAVNFAKRQRLYTQQPQTLISQVQSARPG